MSKDKTPILGKKKRGVKCFGEHGAVVQFCDIEVSVYISCKYL